MVGGNNDKNKGFEVEKFVLNKFNEAGLSGYFTSQRDAEKKYYDIVIFGKEKIKLEVKSCNFLIFNGLRRSCFGRFDFTNGRSIAKQRSNNVYVCFVVCIENSFEILGFMTSKSLKKKFIAKRYLNLKTIMDSRVTRFEKFIKNIC